MLPISRANTIWCSHIRVHLYNLGSSFCTCGFNQCLSSDQARDAGKPECSSCMPTLSHLCSKFKGAPVQPGQQLLHVWFQCLSGDQARNAGKAEGSAALCVESLQW